MAFLGGLDEINDVLFVFGESHRFRHLAIGRSISGVGNAVERIGVEGIHLDLFVQLAEHTVVALELGHDDLHLGDNLHWVAGLEFFI